MPEGREVAGYYILVKDGEIRAGDGAPAECIETSGLSHHRALGGDLQSVRQAIR